MAIELLNPSQLDQMRPAGALVAQGLTKLLATAEGGMELLHRLRAIVRTRPVRKSALYEH